MTKLAQLGDATLYEPAGDQPQQERRRVPYQSRSLAECITNVATPKGKLPILKTMVTTACERNCFYCPFRAGRSKMKRLTFTPDELASGLDTLQRAGQVKGMFLSSGIIKGSVTTQDKIIDTAEIVRNRYHYQGYRVPFGAHLRYLVRSERYPEHVLACLLWTSPAWKMAARDRWSKVRATVLLLCSPARPMRSGQPWTCSER